MTRKDIKKRASELVKQNLETSIFTAAVPCVLSNLLTVLSPLAQGGFLYGKNKIFLEIAKQGKGRLEDLFIGFKGYNSYTKGLLLYVVKSLYIFVGCLLLLIPGLIMWMRYLFAELILADEPDIPVMEAMQKSQFLTKNRMGEVFGFILSFLPWFLLGCIPIFGWVMLAVYILPYFNVAVATYYYALKDEAIRAAERKANFRYPGGTPTRKKLPTGAAAAQQQALNQQQLHAQQQAYAQQNYYRQQAYYNQQAQQPQPPQPQTDGQNQ